MNLTIEETACSSIDVDLDKGSLTGDARKTHIVRSAEIAETIGDETVLVDLDAADNMWPVAVDDISPMVDAEVSQLAQRAAVLTQESFGTVWQMVL